MSFDPKNFHPDALFFQEMLEGLIAMLNSEYKEKVMLNDLRESVLDQTEGKKQIAYTHLTNLLYMQCVDNIQQKRFLIVFNSIWSLFEQILVELILMNHGREFLKSNANESAEPHNTPLMQFIGEKRMEMEEMDPEPLLLEAHRLKIIDDSEYQILKTIKKFIRLTASHSKIKKFVKACIAAGSVKESIPVIQGMGMESLEALLKTGQLDARHEEIEVETDSELLYSGTYENAVAALTPVMLGYYYHFIRIKGSIFSID